MEGQQVNIKNIEISNSNKTKYVILFLFFNESSWTQFIKIRRFVDSVILIKVFFQLLYYIIFLNRLKFMQNSAFKAQTTAQTLIQSSISMQPFIKTENISKKSFLAREVFQNTRASDFMSNNDQIQIQDESAGSSDSSNDEDILEEHKQVFEEMMKKYSSALQIQNHKHRSHQSPHNQNTVTIFKQITLDHFLTILLARLRQVKPAIVHLFHTYLFRQKMFYRFLQYIYYTYPNYVVYRTFKYIFYVWELYYPFQNQNSPQYKIQSISKSIAEKICKSENEPKLNYDHNKCQISEKLMKIIETLAVTVASIMERNPSNPLYCRKQRIDERQHLSIISIEDSKENLAYTS